MESDSRKGKFKISIIGAGVSGLACAHKLVQLGFDKDNIIILEASSILGGRLRKLSKESNFADFDIELGGEEVHGKNSEYFNIVKENGGKLYEYWGNNKFYGNYKN